MKQRVKGFTLVELLVVIAILGVLAAVLVPCMIGYVGKAKISSANSNAKELYNATMLACRESDLIKPIPSGVYSPLNDYTDTESGENGLIAYINTYMGDISDDDWCVYIYNSSPVAVAWRETEASAYLGTYPTSNTEKYENYSALGTSTEALEIAYGGTLPSDTD